MIEILNQQQNINNNNNKFKNRLIINKLHIEMKLR